MIKIKNISQSDSVIYLSVFSDVKWCCCKKKKKPESCVFMCWSAIFNITSKTQILLLSTDPHRTVHEIKCTTEVILYRDPTPMIEHLAKVARKNCHLMGRNIRADSWRRQSALTGSLVLWLIEIPERIGHYLIVSGASEEAVDSSTSGLIFDLCGCWKKIFIHWASSLPVQWCWRQNSAPALFTNWCDRPV